MPKIKQHKVIWSAIIVLGLLLISVQPLFAGDKESSPKDVAYQNAVQHRKAALDEITANREAVIEELISTWFMDEPGWKDEFRSLLISANDSKLLAILNAGSYAEVQAILGGGTPDLYSADSKADPFRLGDTDKDFVYTPVNPCRIVDTRRAGGKILSGFSRGFYVHGSGAQMSAQGGNSAGCTSPRGDPQAVHMDIAAVNSEGSGFLTVWPIGTSRPNASILNYFPGRSDPIANAFTVKTSFGIGLDIGVYAFRTTHVVADVLGYYYDVEEDDFKVRFAGSQNIFISEIIANGGCSDWTDVSIFAPGPGKITVNAQAYVDLLEHTHGIADIVTVFIGTSASDCTLSDGSGGYHAMRWAVPRGHATWTWVGEHPENDEYQSQTIPVSRTFTVTSAGTKTYYLNARRDSGNGNMWLMDAAMQATYYPDF